MANPQIEDGFIRIPNKLLHAMMATEFTGRERRILDAIIRYSYGWNKETAYLTVKQLHQITGLSPVKGSTIHRVLRRLIDANVIKRIDTNLYQLSTDYEKWKINPRRYRPLVASV